MDATTGERAASATADGDGAGRAGCRSDQPRAHVRPPDRGELPSNGATRRDDRGSVGAILCWCCRNSS